MKTFDLVQILIKTTRIFKLGITEIADGTGYSRSTVVRWQKRRNNLTLAQFVDWAEYLGYEVRLYRRDIDSTPPV